MVIMVTVLSLLVGSGQGGWLCQQALPSVVLVEVIYSNFRIF